MSELTSVIRTEQAIVIQVSRTQPPLALQRYQERQERNTAAYRRGLELDAQLIRSEKLSRTGRLISAEQALIEASRRLQDQVIYFTPLQEKVAAQRARLAGDT